LTNNIAEGAGSTHAQEFRQFLNIARRSLFEDASMLMVFEGLGLFSSAEIDGLLTDCDMLKPQNHELLQDAEELKSERPFALCPSLFAR
jgi:four helix bundle protein